MNSSFLTRTQPNVPGLNILKTGGTANTLSQNIMSFFSWKLMGALFVSLIAIGLSYYFYKQYSDKQTVFYANRENIPKDLNANKTATLMLFYVDWCPHCKTAKPEWSTLKDEYDGKTINGYIVNFVEHNCTNETEEISQLMDKYSIEGYPTIKLVKDNQIIEYDAKPTKATMEQFLHTVL